MKMYKLKKISVLPLAYTLAAIYLLIGLIISIIIMAVKNNVALATAINPDLVSITYTQVLLVYPVAYTIGGFVTGLVVGILYNFTAKYTGGIYLEFSKSSIDPRPSKIVKK